MGFLLDAKILSQSLIALKSVQVAIRCCTPILSVDDQIRPKWDLRFVQMKAKKKQSLQFWSWESFSPLNPPPPSRSTSRLMPPAKGSHCFPHQLTKDQAPVPSRKERLWLRKAQSVTIGIYSFYPMSFPRKICI